ncbi:lipase family alpha/beta hydrolase [Flexivirga caeni]|uniref:AB hydrolase-1 domain-containing protein n=1 Tax=Flexivirga caeni TaxID=2294115 RepID=A0A3M9M1X9_9MICO|nr:alpha/beta fold hydrolase [Flexivirga caeni]RNI19472.1 hypothetical protein EFY87_16685 [Flexivirga caeni]
MSVGAGEGEAISCAPRGARQWWRDPVQECTWPVEYAGLLTSPVWRGVGVRDGRDRPVLLIPGFLAGDVSLVVLANWLQRTGYRPKLSGIVWNVGCAERYLPPLRRRLCALAERAGEPVVLVGHSRGGLLANALAGLEPGLVAKVVTLGSPLTDNLDVAPLTAAAVAGARWVETARDPGARSRHCLTSGCLCSYRDGTESAATGPVPLTCVASEDDGIVRPQSCVLPGAKVRWVRGSHLGLATNAQVYRILADELAPAGRPVRRSTTRR